MNNEQVARAERQLQLAHRMIHAEPDTVQKFALLSIAESLLSIAKSFKALEAEETKGEQDEQ